MSGQGYALTQFLLLAFASADGAKPSNSDVNDDIDTYGIIENVLTHEPVSSGGFNVSSDVCRCLDRPKRLTAS